MKSLRFFAAPMILFLATAAFSQAADKPMVVPMSTTKFISLPVVPACLTLSPQSGDPTKGEALMLVKMKPGCVVPWHWHTPIEDIMMVSGKGKIEMKGEAAHGVGSGDYIHLSPKNVHQFTCSAACTFFLYSNGSLDFHYLDKDGKEITPEQALKPAAKPAAKGKSK